jgi:hypothetical protein
LEICVLISVGYWGFKTGSGWLPKLLLGIGVPALIAVIWGMFGAPNSTFHLQGLSLFVLELIVFGSGVAALFLTKHNFLAWALALTIIVNRILMSVWKQ